MSLPLAPLTSALLAALRTSTFAIGDGEPPRPLPPDTVPYAILDHVAGGSSWGPPLVDPNQAAGVVYQLRAVGRTRAQAQSLADRLEVIVLGRGPTGAFTTPITVAGAVVAGRDLDSRGGVDREGDVFNATSRYVLDVVPA